MSKFGKTFGRKKSQNFRSGDSGMKAQLLVLLEIYKHHLCLSRDTLFTQQSS